MLMTCQNIIITRDRPIEDACVLEIFSFIAQNIWSPRVACKMDIPVFILEKLFSEQIPGSGPVAVSTWIYGTSHQLPYIQRLLKSLHHNNTLLSLHIGGLQIETAEEQREDEDCLVSLIRHNKTLQALDIWCEEHVSSSLNVEKCLQEENYTLMTFTFGQSSKQHMLDPVDLQLPHTKKDCKKAIIRAATRRNRSLYATSCLQHQAAKVHIFNCCKRGGSHEALYTGVALVDALLDKLCLFYRDLLI